MRLIVAILLSFAILGLTLHANADHKGKAHAKLSKKATAYSKAAGKVENLTKLLKSYLQDKGKFETFETMEEESKDTKGSTAMDTKSGQATAETKGIWSKGSKAMESKDSTAMDTKQTKQGTTETKGIWSKGAGREQTGTKSIAQKSTKRQARKGRKHYAPAGKGESETGDAWEAEIFTYDEPEAESTTPIGQTGKTGKTGPIDSTEQAAPEEPEEPEEPMEPTEPTTEVETFDYEVLGPLDALLDRLKNLFSAAETEEPTVEGDPLDRLNEFYNRILNRFDSQEAGEFGEIMVDVLQEAKTNRDDPRYERVRNNLEALHNAITDISNHTRSREEASAPERISDIVDRLNFHIKEWIRRPDMESNVEKVMDNLEESASDFNSYMEDINASQ